METIMFYVVDEAGNERYAGSDLGSAYRLWRKLAARHEMDMPDAYGEPITDMDCGGGSSLTMVLAGEYVGMYDSACDRQACSDCHDPDVPVYDVA